jgi:hypothetical protein
VFSICGIPAIMALFSRPPCRWRVSGSSPARSASTTNQTEGGVGRATASQQLGQCLQMGMRWGISHTGKGICQPFSPFSFFVVAWSGMDITPPPPLPPSLTHCLCVKYSYSHKEVGGEGGRLEPERRGHKAGSHIPIWLTVSPVYKLWQTSRLRIIGNADVFQGNLRVVECQLRKGCPLQRPSVDRWDALSDENPCSFPVSIYSLHSGSITGYILMRIRIRLFTLMRIRIQLLKCSNQCCGTGTIGTVTFWLVDSEPEP